MSDRLTRLARTAGTLLLVAAVALVGVLAVPGVVGAKASYVVLSGSMAPQIQPGDVVVVDDAAAEQIHEGDVISFYVDGSFGGPGRDRVTHRVVEKHHTADGVTYETKGDANDDRDPWTVAQSQVIGTVSFHVPYVGRLFLFAQRPLGAALLVALPGLLLVASGFRTLYRAADSDG